MFNFWTFEGCIEKLAEDILWQLKQGFDNHLVSGPQKLWERRGPQAQ